MKQFHSGTENHPAFACFISMTMSVQVNTAGGISVLEMMEIFIVAFKLKSGTLFKTVYVPFMINATKKHIAIMLFCRAMPLFDLV